MGAAGAVRCDASPKTLLAAPLRRVQSETAPGTPADLLRKGQTFSREQGRYDRGWVARLACCACCVCCTCWVLAAAPLQRLAARGLLPRTAARGPTVFTP